MNAVPSRLPVPRENDTDVAPPIHHPPIGSCLLDRDLRCTSLSRNLAAMPGLPFVAHPSHNVIDALPAPFAEVRQALLDVLNGVAADGIGIRGEVLSPVAAGRSFVISVQPMQGLGNEIAGVLLSFLDVTEQQQM